MIGQLSIYGFLIEWPVSGLRLMSWWCTPDVLLARNGLSVLLMMLGRLLLFLSRNLLTLVEVGWDQTTELIALTELTG